VNVVCYLADGKSEKNKKIKTQKYTKF